MPTNYRSGVPYEGRLLDNFPIAQDGAPVRSLIHTALHGRTIEDRAEGLYDLLDYLGVFGPKAPTADTFPSLYETLVPQEDTD